MQYLSRRIFSHILAVTAAGILCSSLVPVPAAAQRQAARVEQVSRTSQSVTYRITTSWDRDLNAYVRPSAGATASDTVRVRRILSAAQGFTELSEMVRLSGDASPSVQVVQADYQEASVTDSGLSDLLVGTLGETAAEVVGIGTMRGEKVGSLVAHLLTFHPQEGVVRRYRSLRIKIGFQPSTPRARAAANRRPDASASSDLSEGSWIKIPITEQGVYRITRGYLADSLGVNPDNIDPSNIGVYGNGGERLPAPNDAPRPEGLLAVPSLVNGGGDGTFGGSDAVMFYAEEPQGWKPSDADDGAPAWEHYVNPFTTTTYYFLRLDDPDPARVEPATRGAEPSGSARTSFLQRRFVEADQVNLGADGGSGLEWFSRSFERSNSRSVLSDYTLPGKLDSGVDFRVRAAVAATRRSDLSFAVNGSQAAELSVPSISNTSTGLAARTRQTAFTVQNAGNTLNLDVSFTAGPAGAVGYMDWTEVFYQRSLTADDDYLRFHSPLDASGIVTFALEGFSSSPLVWDVSEPDEVGSLPVSGGAPYRTAIEASTPRELVAFRPASASVQIPGAGTAIDAQNLRGISGYPDGVIVTPDTFRSQAEDLAAFRRSQGLSVTVASVEDIYNEFSGGRPDMRAVRDYLKFLYDRSNSESQRLRYALLFGDGHVDYRGLTDPVLNNWVLPYETQESLRRIATYTSDDYFGLLDDDEGTWEWDDSQDFSNERVDIGVGRLPVQTSAQAAAVVAKLKQYNRQVSFGQWRGEYTMVADDGPTGGGNDRDLHTQNMEAVAQVVRAENRNFNLNKIYAQSYPAQTTAQGRRVPGARDDVIRSLEEGTLLWNYTGHGGPDALAQERLFDLEDIEVLQNSGTPTIGITATCSFGHWDMPDRQSGAEKMVLRAPGGAVAMMTTVRIVFTSSSIRIYNVGLNRALNRAMLERGSDGRPRRLGDIMRITKNTDPGAQGNNRKFNLLGDPMTRLGMPDQPGRMVRIDGVALEDTTVTLPALKEVSLTGEVLNHFGQRETSFNGTATFTVFDARRHVQLRPEQTYYLPDSSDGGYTVRNDVVYRGRARVEDGEFSSSFVVPKDITYSDDPARLSFYVQSDDRDGFGATEQLRLNGTADDPVTDPDGPRVELFLGDTTFVSGGLTGTNPELIVNLQDESGLNSAGAGVGHETLLTVDGKEQEAVDIGRYFESNVGNSREGQIRYQLPQQEPGPHTLKVTSWDVVNNATESTLDYYVAPQEDLTIRNLYNYPNPTSGATRFIVEHNQSPGTLADVQVRIYTLSGRPVRTIERQMTLSSGPLQIPWDGMDQDLDPLATGVYLYKVRIAVNPMNSQKKVAERIERLAILR